MNKLKQIGRFMIPVAASLLPFTSLAAINYPTVTGTGSGTAWDTARITQLLETVANFMIGIGITIAVIFIIWGGIKYMSAGGDSKKADEAKTAIINGIIGAVIVLGVGVILRTAAGFITGSFFGI